MIVNSSRGGGSKDTWVLEDGEADDRAESRLPDPLPPALPDLRYGGWTGQAQQQQQQRATRLMLARIAHELYWLGRNLVARRVHRARRRRRLPGRAPGRRRRRRAGRRRSAGASCSRCSAALEAGAVRATREEALQQLTLDPDGARRRCAPRSSARARARAPCATSSAPTCGRRSTRPRSTLRGDGDGGWLAPGGPYLACQYVKERVALICGPRRPHDAARRGARRSSTPAATSRPPTWCCGCCASPSRAGDDAAAGGQALALLQAVGGFQAFRRAVPGAAERAARSRASCCSSAPTRTASRPASTRCTTRSRRPTRARATPSRCCA